MIHAMFFYLVRGVTPEALRGWVQESFGGAFLKRGQPEAQISCWC